MRYPTQAPQTLIRKRVRINKHPKATPIGKTRSWLLRVLLQIPQVLLRVLQVLEAVRQELWKQYYKYYYYYYYYYYEYYKC